MGTLSSSRINLLKCILEITMEMAKMTKGQMKTASLAKRTQALTLEKTDPQRAVLLAEAKQMNDMCNAGLYARN